MTMRGFLGIDCGTQGLSVIYTDEQLNVQAVGEGGYGMIAGLTSECYEQHPNDWIAALKEAMNQLRAKLPPACETIGVGISGQMHGEVHADENGQPLGTARLWCDGRNEMEGHELTERFGVKMPKRATASRWLWTIRNQPEKAASVRRLTTPAGWISYCLTGQWTLGIGDAAGMFPIDQSTFDYDETLLKSFDALVSDSDIQPLKSLLPAVRTAGEDAGTVNSAGAEILGISAGVPVAPAEGDQPAALAGSLIGTAGLVSCSFGTSVCANSVGDKAFVGVNDAVDHFCAPDGKPINMVCLRNGTTFMNTMVEMFGMVLEPSENPFDAVMPKLLEAAPDCGGLMALPFMDDEPGLGVSRGGTAMMVGLNAANATPGNIVKAALVSTIFNLRLGSEVLIEQGHPRTELVLSGGLTKTPELAQLLADIFDTPVSLLASSEEGTAWGAALMAKFRLERLNGNEDSWSDFLAAQAPSVQQRFEPNQADAKQYDGAYQLYRQLVAVNQTIGDALGAR